MRRFLDRLYLAAGGLAAVFIVLLDRLGIVEQPVSGLRIAPDQAG